MALRGRRWGPIYAHLVRSDVISFAGLGQSYNWFAGVSPTTDSREQFNWTKIGATNDT